MLVVDSSVALKWFLDEEGSDAALKLLQKEQFAAPDLLIYELINSLVLKSPFTIDDVKKCLNQLMRFDIDFFVLTERILGRTAELARAFHLTAYDASFIALAENLEFNFITADYKLVQKVKNLSFVHYLLD